MEPKKLTETWVCIYKKDRKKHKHVFGATNEADAARYMLTTFKVNPEDIVELHRVPGV